MHVTEEAESHEQCEMQAITFKLARHAGGTVSIRYLIPTNPTSFQTARAAEPT